MLTSRVSDRSREQILVVEQQKLLELITTGHPVDECLSAITAAATRLVPGACAAVIIADDARGSIDRVVSSSMHPSFGTALRGGRIGEALLSTCATAMYRGEPIACSDIASDVQWSNGWRNLCLECGLHACHSTPVFSAGGEAFASFALFFTQRHECDGWERSIGRFGAHFAGIALERENTASALRASQAQLESELADTRLIAHTSAELIREENIDALYEKIIDAAAAIMRSDFASMQLLHQDGRNGSAQLHLLASRGFDPRTAAFWRLVRVDSGSCCAEALRTGRRSVVADVRECDFIAGTQDEAVFALAGIRAVQSTPLVSRAGATLGMISTLWREPHQPSERDLRLFDILARQAADLLEHKLAEKALHESESRLRAFVAASSDAMFRMNADWSEMRYLDGRNFLADTSAPSKMWLQAYVHPDDRPEFAAAVQAAVSAKAPFELEHRVIRIDGTAGWASSRAVPLLDEKFDVIEWFGAAQDITARKQAEEQQQLALRTSERIVETLQTAFLPQSLPQSASLHFDALYLPGEGELVGGDWYDAERLPDGRFLISVGDVTGHGLAAAVVAAKLRQAATVSAFASHDPADILKNMNRVLRFQYPGVYVTAIVAIVDANCTHLSYACAGHPRPLLATKSDAAAVALADGGLPLGVQDDLGVETCRVAIPANSVIAFFSDGLIEFARDAVAAEERLKNALASLIDRPDLERPAATILKEMLGDAHSTDDIVLLLARFCERQKEWQFHSNDVGAARTARRELMAFAQQLDGDSETGFAAVTILGEALANAVRHAAGPVRVAVDGAIDTLVLTVTDSGPGWEGGVFAAPRDPLAENGRGLFLMKSLAEDLTIHPGPDGGTQLRARIRITHSKPAD